MGTILFVYYLFLVFSCQLQGSTAKTPVFVKKGEDVVLELMRHDVPKDFLFLLWQFNKTDTLVTFTPGTVSRNFTAYEGRVEPSVTNYSVKLKNLQVADSGVYTAQVTAERQEVLAEYHITVQDPVSPVHLTLNSVSRNSDSCNLTVTCKTQDSHHINSTVICHNHTCSQEGGERSKATTSGASLRVYLSDNSIICNYSNHVSWTQDNKTAEQFCFQYVESLKTRERDIVIVCSLAFVGCVVVGLVLFYRDRKRKDDSENIDNTVYATCETDPKARPQCPTTNNASSPNSVYAVVGPHTGRTETRASPISQCVRIEKPAE